MGLSGGIRDQDGIRQAIGNAIDKGGMKNIIWVSYDGHQRPFIPRAIKPTKWGSSRPNSSRKETSFYAIQHRSKFQTQQRFYLKNVVEVRDRHWELPQHEFRALMKKHSNRISQQNQYNSYQNNNSQQNYDNNSSRNYQSQRKNNYNSARNNSSRNKSHSSSSSYDQQNQNNSASKENQ